MIARLLANFSLCLSAAVVGALVTVWYLDNHYSPPNTTVPDTALLATPSPVIAQTPERLEPHSPPQLPLDINGSIAPETQEDDAAVLLTLHEALRAEQQARRSLTEDLQQLRRTVQRLEQQLVVATTPEPTSEAVADEQTPRQADVPSLVAVGFLPEDAEHLVWRWGEQQMAELYLRDQARREGWQDTPDFQNALDTLRHGEGSLRNEMNEDDYEAMLYAMGQPNRLLIRDVIPASPAQLVGLQAGDQLLDYNGTRIFNYRELRQHMEGGVPDELVPVRIARGMQTLEVFLPRGPLGVQLGADSVAPEG